MKYCKMFFYKNLTSLVAVTVIFCSLATTQYAQSLNSSSNAQDTTLYNIEKESLKGDQIGTPDGANEEKNWENLYKSFIKRPETLVLDTQNSTSKNSYSYAISYCSYIAAERGEYKMFEKAITNWQEWRDQSSSVDKYCANKSAAEGDLDANLHKKYNDKYIYERK